MINQLKLYIRRILGLKPRKIQTFTYYIPAPPERKSGYREKQFDKVFYEFINRGYRILNFRTVPHSGVNSSGMWVIIIVEATGAKADKLDLEFDSFIEEGPTPTDVSEVEGLYYIKNDEDHVNEN